jgi:pimeloyl-ACP methyl ester carboxylesterase
MRAMCILVGVAVVAVAAGCGSGPADDRSIAPAAPTVSTSTGRADHEIDDTFVVGRDRHHLAMRCLGTEPPTIILEAGTDTSGIEVFGPLMGSLSDRTRTCTYDRVGTGSSDAPSERRRTLDDVSADLHALLESARVQGPHVLVGSSGGGDIALYYAGRYPKGIAGVVLLDVGGPNPNLGKEFPGAKAWGAPSTSTGWTASAGWHSTPARSEPSPSWSPRRQARARLRPRSRRAGSSSRRGHGRPSSRDRTSSTGTTSLAP